MRQIHAQARTALRTRAQIKSSALPLTKLAECCKITKAAAYKWKSRELTADCGHCPHQLNMTLTPGVETFSADLRRLVLLPLDYLPVVPREFINLAVSPSRLGLCLQCHDIGGLCELQVQANRETEVSPKSFEDRILWFIHGDIKYLPRMSCGIAQGHIFLVAIVRATGSVFCTFAAALPVETIHIKAQAVFTADSTLSPMLLLLNQQSGALCWKICKPLICKKNIEFMSCRWLLA